jgi:hypothetical protein
VFDEQTGTENLTVLFSRQPVADLEEMIYSLQDRKGHKQMLEQPHVDIADATVGRLREASTRDLIIEKVDASTPAGFDSKKETAVYVVNPAEGENSRLAADLHLVHR